MNDDVQSLCISDGMVGALVSCNGLGDSYLLTKIDKRINDV